MKSFLFYTAITLIAVTAWLQLDFEQYLSTNKYRFHSFGIEDRQNYEPALVFTLRWYFGQHEDVQKIGKVIYHNKKLDEAPDLRDAYIVNCYFSPELKERILAKGDW